MHLCDYLAVSVECTIRVHTYLPTLNVYACRLSLTNRPVIVAINKIDLKPRPTPSTDSEPRGPDDTQDSSDTTQCGQCAGGGKQRGISGGRFAPGPVLPLDEAKALWRQRLPRAGEWG